MSYDKMDSSAVYALFEEIKSKLNKKTEPAAPVAPVVPPAPAIRQEDIAEMRRMTESVQEIVEAVGQPQKHIHKHTIDMMSNKMLVAFVIAITLMMISFCIIVRQWSTIADYKDNDLKYRYIEMKGKADPEDIEILLNVFNYNRNPECIKEIRKQVKQYERLVREQAETAARAKLNAKQAEQYRQQAESVKSRR